MKRAFALAVFLGATHLWAANIYVAQSSAGGNTGADCANARALSTLAAGDWVAGNTIHLCGTITGTPGASGLVAHGSGTSGSPIIVQFEPNAILQATYFGGIPNASSCYSLATCMGGIQLYNNSNIIIDGGTNGIIQNTANGTNLANYQASLGISISGGSNFIVRNLTVKNIYINDPTSQDTAGGYTGDVSISNGATNVAVCNNALLNARAGIQSDTGGGSAPLYPLPVCSSNTFASGVNFFSNTLNDHAWQFQPSGSSSPIVNIFNNDVSGNTNWLESGNEFHTDGIIAWGDLGVQLTVYAFNNGFHDTNYGTAAIYCTYGQTGSGSACYIFNNVFTGTGAPIWLNGDATYQLGPYNLFNNTFINNGLMIEFGADDQTSTIKNNLVTEGTTSNNYFYSKGYGTNTLPSILTDSDYNNFYGGRGLSFHDPTGYYCWPQSGGSPSGCGASQLGPWVNQADTHSISGNPLLNANYTLQASSPDIGAGANLTSLCSTIAPLCYDKNGVQRPAVGAWDIGAYNGPSGGGGVEISGTAATGGTVVHR
jgi:hypothetical protein